MANQRLTLDLAKNKELADLISDMEPGDSIYAELSIVAKDDQTLTAEVEAVGESTKALDNKANDEKDEPTDSKADDGDEPAQSNEGDNANNPFVGSGS